MFARAAVSVSACADFVIEGAVDLVLFGTENGREVVGHDRREFLAAQDSEDGVKLGEGSD